MNKRKNIFTVIFAVLGFLAIYAESEYGLSIGVLIGLGLLGLSSTIWGIEKIITRRGTYTTGGQDSSRIEMVRGIAAIMSGLVLLLVGAGLIASSLLGLAGLGNFAIDFLKARPGIGLLFLGALGSAFSFQLMLGSEQSRRGFWAILGSIPGRVFGFFLFLFSAGLLLAGIVEVFLPDTFQQIFEDLISRLRLPDFSG